MLRVKKNDISLEILHQAWVKTSPQTSTLAKLNPRFFTIAPRPYLTLSKRWIIILHLDPGFQQGFKTF